MNPKISELVNKAGCGDRWMDDALAKVEKVKDLHTFNSCADGTLEPSSIGVDHQRMEDEDGDNHREISQWSLEVEVVCG